MKKPIGRHKFYIGQSIIVLNGVLLDRLKKIGMMDFFLTMAANGSSSTVMA